MIRYCLILFLGLVTLSSHAHPWKAQHYVIVDTDCGIDDYRAINMLISNPSFRILGISISNGIVDAKTGYKKVKSLMHQFSHEGLLTGINPNEKIKPYNCKEAVNFSWGENEEVSEESMSSFDLINEVLNNTSAKITFICLASMNTICSAYEKNPALAERIDKIIFMYGNEKLTKCYNYKLDSTSFIKLIAADLPITLVNSDVFGITYDDDIIHEINNINNSYSSNFVNSLINSGSKYSKQWCDEFAVLYLFDPDLFDTEKVNGYDIYKINTLKGISHLEHTITEILSGNTPNSTQVLSSFSFDTADYKNDIRSIIPETILQYGKEEWLSCVLANELHRHLGIYNIVGVKMGIRAIEYFDAGIDEVEIVSYAGKNPPVSCMNDGLQVSTGATLGHGLIEISQDAPALPMADFRYMNRQVTLALKDNYLEIIKNDISSILRKHGLDTDIYWSEVRKLAIKYWVAWDRKEIFDIIIK